MSDISNSKWEPLDEANTHPSPDGITKDGPPNGVPDTIRSMRGALKREQLWRNAIYVSTGTGNAYVLTYPQAPEGYVKGLPFSFWADKSNTGPATLNINGLGTKQILNAAGGALVAGQIVSNCTVCAEYDGANFRLAAALVNPVFTGISTFTAAASFAGAVTIEGGKAWHSGNDGQGSGLDADVLRGAAPTVNGVGNSITQRRSDGTVLGASFVTDQAANAGTIYLGSNGLHYLNYDGTNYNMANGGLSVGGQITTHGNAVNVNSNGNSHVWYQQNGVNRSVAYYDAGLSMYQVNLHDTAGNYARAFNYRQSDGRFYVSGYVQTPTYIADNGRYRGQDGNGWNIFGTNGTGGTVAIRPWGTENGSYELLINSGGVTWAGQSLVRNDGGRWNIGINGSSGSVRNPGNGVEMQFNWSGQGGQPQWLWGGNDGANMYVYNPANFTVNYAHNAGSLGGVGAGGYAQFTQSGNQAETFFPVGQILMAYTRNVTAGRRELLPMYLYAPDVRYYTVGYNAGTQCVGAWRQIGAISTDWQLFQRMY